MENIMKLYVTAIALCFTLVFLSCRDIARQGAKASGGTTNPRQPADSIQYYDSIFSAVKNCQDSVYNKPESETLAAKLLLAAYDTVSGSFLVVGKAVFNPDFPQQAQTADRKRASKYIGERWALYLKAWQAGNSIPFGKPIAGTIAYSKELSSREKGDTLFQLLMIPFGSIILDIPAVQPAAGKSRNKNRK
jgi:hypothetical protein